MHTGDPVDKPPEHIDQSIPREARLDMMNVMPLTDERNMYNLINKNLENQKDKCKMHI